MVPSLEEDARRWSELQGSIKMENWMAAIRESSSLEESPDDWWAWKDLMLFFHHGDVSGIEHLKLRISLFKLPPDDVREASHGFGFVLRTGRFSALKGLEILCWSVETLNNVAEHEYDFEPGRNVELARKMDLGLGSASLGGAFRTGLFTNLHELHLEAYDEFDFSDIFEALVEGRVCRLTSLSIQGDRDGPSADQKFDALLKSQCMRNLTHLKIVGRQSLATVCAQGIKSGLLPNVRSLYLSWFPLLQADLLSLVGAPGNWFSSLECLRLSSCSVSARHVGAIVEAIMNHPESELPLKILDLDYNVLDYSAIDALVPLVESGRLSQLRELRLSSSKRTKWNEAFARLMQSIQRGRLPRLQRLHFWGNLVGDKGAEAVVQAYFKNEALTADIRFDWQSVSDRSLETKASEFKQRNVRLVALRNELEGDEFKDLSQLRSAKVFLCGFPEVGKTTSRKSLGKDFGLSTRLQWERRPKLNKEPRTKGIELRHIKDPRTGTRLMLWDLAGQEEFHVLHGTFLADLGFAGGKATTFVIVFRVPAHEDGEAKLLYWLKFVASSSIKLVKRQVLIVLNRFKGYECLDSDKSYWKGLIQTYAEKFDDLLRIDPDPVIIDARVAASVQALKDHLFTQAGLLLRDEKVPEACFKILEHLKNWSKGENKSRLPIFSWKTYEEHWESTNISKRDTIKNLKVCALYLHEIGEIIFLDEQESTQSQSRNKRIVVPDPEWFCKQVVGHLLLPKGMLKGDRSIQVSADGTISPLKFEAYFKHLLPDGTESDDVISMLQQLGLCYKKGLDKIAIPALIGKDDYASLGWELQGFHGVMGRCLAVDDMDRCAIPGTLFRRLQVELAKDPDLGGRGDSDYRAGRSYSSFKRGHLLALVQFDVDHSDPSNDRIDILVKSVLREDSTVVRLAKVDCICEIMQKLERLCVICCPGLRYGIKLVEPWNAKDRTAPMPERRLMSLTEIKSLLVKGQDYLAWNLNGDPVAGPVEIKTLLSKSELEGLLGTAQHEYKDCKHKAVSLGLLTEDSIQKLEEVEQKIGANAQGPATEGGIDSRSAEIVKIKELLQALYSFCIAEKKNVVPRFLLLKKKDDSGFWTSCKDGIKAPFRKDYRLHFLCESQFDDGNLHWVEDQEGVKLSKSTAVKDWLHEVEPWVRWSFYMATVVAKIALTVLVPGTAGAVPTISTSTKKHDRPRDIAVKMLHDKDETIHDRNPADVAGKLIDLKGRPVAEDHGSVGTSDQFIDVKTKLIAQGVVEDLMRELGMAKFLHGTRLRRVLLKATPQHDIGCSQPAESVLWICMDCLQKYGEERATDITP